ncbi:MAG TPA: glycerophosphodiester phosphodiesterase family protein [Pseudonocardia sp.]
MRSTPIVIGHRGAPAHRPEHTLAGYELAIRLGADFVEPDLVSTADGVLIARHDDDLTSTTDLAAHPALAGKLVHELTLAQVRTLRATERLPDLRAASRAFDGRFPVPTLDEILALCLRLGAELGRRVGVYLELKHPARFAHLGLPLGPPLVAALEAAGLNAPDAPVIVESFEIEPLRELREPLHVPISQLVEPGPAAQDMLTPKGLAEIATYAQCVSPNKDLVIPRDAAGRLAAPSTLVADAHAAGLGVHCWTFRDEAPFRPAGLDAAAEYIAFFDAGVDAVFADQPDTAVAARRSWMMRA